MLAVASARLPRFGTRRATFIGVHLIVEAVDAVRNRRALQSTRERTKAIDFPLDRKMTMIVTRDRLAIFRVRRGTEPAWLGDVQRSRIESATLPYVSSGWRTVVLDTADHLRIRFQVAGPDALRFVETLTSAQGQAIVRPEAKKYPALHLLFGAYFHQDWDLESNGDPWIVVDNYAQHETTSAVAALDEIEQLVDSSSSEQELASLIDLLGCSYSVEADGWTHRAWLAAVAQRIKAALQIET